MFTQASPFLFWFDGFGGSEVAWCKEKNMAVETQEPQKGQTFERVGTMFEETDRQVEELTREIFKATNNPLSRLVKAMYSVRLLDEFAALGYAFTMSCEGKTFRENAQTLVQSDVFLENELYVMPVEVTPDLTTEDVDDYLEQLATIRNYMDNHGDKRSLVGAVAGGIAPENVV
jgi:hypothetical protein